MVRRTFSLLPLVSVIAATFTDDAHLGTAGIWTLNIQLDQPCVPGNPTGEAARSLEINDAGATPHTLDVEFIDPQTLRIPNVGRAPGTFALLVELNDVVRSAHTGERVKHLLITPPNLPPEPA